MQALPIRVVSESRTGGVTRYQEIWQFIDASRTKILVASACPGLSWGLQANPSPCPGNRVSGTYAEAGLPGALGASAVWNQPITTPVISFSSTLAGKEIPALYSVAVSRERGSSDAPCFIFEAVDGYGHLLEGQAVSPFSSLPTSLVVCTDSGLPLSVAFPGEPSLRRTSHHRAEPRRETFEDTGVDPWSEPADPQVSAPREGAPHDSSYDPAGFPVREALHHVTHGDERGRRFVERNAGHFLRYSTFESISRGETLSLIERHMSARRHLEVEGRDGELLVARVEKKCTLVGCEIRTVEISESESAPSAASRDDLVSLPYDRLERKANRTLPGPVFFYSVGTVFRSTPVDFGSGKEYLYTFFSNDPHSMLPYYVRFRGGNGGLLSFDLDEARGNAIIGLDLKRLRDP